MPSRTVRLILTVTYEHHPRQEDQKMHITHDMCAAPLDELVTFAVNEGLLTGDSDLIVADYSHVVESTHCDPPPEDKTNECSPTTGGVETKARPDTD